MSDVLREVKFGDLTLWLLADVEGGEGPLCARPEDYEQGICSYAHLMDDGTIMRFHQAIGARHDLVYTGRTHEATPARWAIINTLTHPSWDGPGDSDAR